MKGAAGIACLAMIGIALILMPGLAVAADPPPLIALPEPESPFVAFDIWVHTGSQNDPPGKEGLAWLTARLIAGGSTRSDSFEEINRKLYPLAASYSVSVDKEMTVITGRVHRDNLEEYYAILRDVVLEPGFLVEDFERIRSGQVNYVERPRRYGNDEELSKILLFREAFRGTPYEHPAAGYVSSVKSLTLSDVREFYEKNYVRNNITVALGGSYPDRFDERVRSDFDSLPEREVSTPPRPAPKMPGCVKVVIVDKETDATSVSIGFPIAVVRGDADFIPLWTATNWLGVHRNAVARLFQAIRAARGLNYGDYAYIEAFPRGFATSRPRVNVARRSQLFEIWIRPVARTSETDLHERAIFATRCALRELKRMIRNGLTRSAFSDTQDLLRHYAINNGAALARRLAYAVDDAFYGIPEPGFLRSVRPALESLDRETVNRAITSHLLVDNMYIVFITNDAEGLKEMLVDGLPTAITYAAEEQPKRIVDEDVWIARFPMHVDEENVTILDIDDVLEE